MLYISYAGGYNTLLLCKNQTTTNALLSPKHKPKKLYLIQPCARVNLLNLLAKSN